MNSQTKTIYDAYWINPNGKITGVEITHIQAIIKNPKYFMLTKEYIEKIYKKHNENLGLEGYAREEIMENLISNNNWIRVRRNKNFWTIQLSNYDIIKKEQLIKFTKYMITENEISQFSEIRIITMNKQLIVTSFEDLSK